MRVDPRHPQRPAATRPLARPLQLQRSNHPRPTPRNVAVAAFGGDVLRGFVGPTEGEDRLGGQCEDGPGTGYGQAERYLRLTGSEPHGVLKHIELVSIRQLHKERELYPIAPIIKPSVLLSQQHATLIQPPQEFLASHNLLWLGLLLSAMLGSSLRVDFANVHDRASDLVDHHRPAGICFVGIAA
jgi:hypothetical protein